MMKTDVMLNPINKYGLSGLQVGLAHLIEVHAEQSTVLAWVRLLRLPHLNAIREAHVDGNKQLSVVPDSILLHELHCA